MGFLYEPQAILTNVVMADGHVALLENGDVVGLSNSETSHDAFDFGNVITSNAEYIDSSWEDDFSMIKNDNTLWVFGNNSHQRLGLPSDVLFVDEPRNITNDVERISVLNSGVIFQISDGSLWGFGRNSNGELGQGNKGFYSEPVLICSEVIDFSSAGDASLFIGTDGNLYGAGRDLFLESNTLAPVVLMTKVEKIYAGDRAIIIQNTAGLYWGWGYDTYRFGLGESQIRYEAVEIPASHF